MCSSTGGINLLEYYLKHLLIILNILRKFRPTAKNTMILIFNLDAIWLNSAGRDHHLVVHHNIEDQAQLQSPWSGLPHLSWFKIPWHFPDKLTFFPDNFFYFTRLKNIFNCYKGQSNHIPRILKRQLFNTNNQWTLSLYLPSRHM